MSSLTNLIHAYEFDEASGNMLDKVGSADLVEAGAGSPTYQVAGVNGDNAIEVESGNTPSVFRIAFNDANNFHDAPTFDDGSASSFLSGDFTIENWVYPTRLTTQVLIGNWVTTTGYRLYILGGTSGKLVWQEGDGATNKSVTTASTVVQDAWNQIIVEHTHGVGTSVEINRKGAISVGQALQIPPLASTGFALFGEHGAGNPYQGRQGYFRRNNRLLSEAEKTWRYNGGLGRKFTEFTPAATASGVKSYNLTNIAKRIKSEDCHMLILGDSQNVPNVNRGPSGILRTWKPDKWVGSYGVATQHANGVALGLKDRADTGITHELDSITGINFTPSDIEAAERTSYGFDHSPSLGVVAIYSAASNIADDASMIDFSLEYNKPGTGTPGTSPIYLDSLGNEVDPFAGERVQVGAAFWNEDGVQTKFLYDALSTGGTKDHIFRFGVPSVLFGKVSSAGLPTKGGAVGQEVFGFTSMSYLGPGSGVSDSGRSRVIASQAASTIDETGRNIVVLSYWWEIVDGSNVRVPGFSMDTIGNSGWAAWEHLEFMTRAARGSATQAEHNAAVDGYLNNVGQPNTFMIMFGHNGDIGHWNGVSADAAVRYRDNIDNLITRMGEAAASYDTPVTDPHFLLVAPWFGGAMNQARRDILFEIAQARTDFEVGVISLFDIYNGVDPGWGNVHPQTQAQANEWASKAYSQFGGGGGGRLVPIMAAQRRR